MSKNTSEIEIIKIVENLISNFDPIPSSSKKAQYVMNENDNYPSLTLINKKFKDLNGLKLFYRKLMNNSVV